MGKRLLMVMLVAVAGCAPATEWTRVNTGQPQMMADEKQCEGIADNQVSLEMSSSHALFPPYTDTLYVMGARSATGGHSYESSYSREGPRKYELVDYCMTQRGYTLTPIAPRPAG